MKHIQTPSTFNNKKILESNLEQPTDPFSELFELSTSFCYNLSMYKKKFETNLEIKFDDDDDDDLNRHLYSQIKEVILNTELLLDSVKNIRAELKL